METSSYAEAERSHRIFGSVSKLMELRLAAGSRQCGASGGKSVSASRRVVDALAVMLDRCMCSHRSSTLTGSVARACRDATPSLALRVVWRTVSTTAATARRSSEDVCKVWQGLSPISEKFTFVAAFSNVHGMYKARKVKLQPELSANFQEFASQKGGP